jgi:tetratricopeptide (TPR) repeat protein
MKHLNDSLRLRILNVLHSNEFEPIEIQEIKEMVLELNDTNLKVSLAYLFDRWSDYLVSVIDEQEIDQQFEFALTKNKEAILLNPSFDKYYYNWGVSLGVYANYKSGEEKEKITQLEIEKYKIAASLNDNYESTYYNWGKCLLTTGLTKEVDQGIVCIQESIKKLEKSVSINLWHTNAWSTLGTAYSYLGDFDTKNRGDWYEKSIFCYSMVTEIKPYDGDAYDNWGIALKSLALLKENTERESLLLLAIQKHLIAIQKGSGTYNMACTYAALGDERNAFIHLSRAIETEDVQIEEIFEDADWVSYIDHKEFKAITSKK